MRMSIRKGALGLVAACALLFTSAAPAFAANNFGTAHRISGTCIENGTWYISDTVRTRSSGANSSRVQFSLTPTNGIAFYVWDWNSGIGHGIVYAPPLNTWLDLADGDAPYQFVNVFALESAGKQNNYSFTASEQY